MYTLSLNIFIEPFDMHARYHRIEQIVTDTLQPTLLQIIDESENHRVPIGAESHFKLTIVASQFRGLSRIARHQRVHHALQHELSTGLHALSLALYTPEEWAQHPTQIASPLCQHKPRNT